MEIRKIFEMWLSNQDRALILFQRGWRRADGMKLAYMYEELGNLYDLDDILEICDFLEEKEYAESEILCVGGKLE